MTTRFERACFLPLVSDPTTTRPLTRAHFLEIRGRQRSFVRRYRVPTVTSSLSSAVNLIRPQRSDRHRLPLARGRYHGLAGGHLIAHRLLMRPQLNAGTLG